MKQPRHTGLILAAIICASAFWASSAPGQKSTQQETLLQRAIQKETVDGDLEGAMVLYRQIIAANGQNRAVTAKALLGLGGCLERLGQQEARKVYERLLAEYSDQAQEVTQARDRLAAISRTARESSREPHFRRVAMATSLGNGDARLSPDGKEVAFTDRGAVWVVPVASPADADTTGIPTKLTGEVDALGVVWSPDGRSIAFNTRSGISLIARSGGVPKEAIKVPSVAPDGRMRTISVSPNATRLAYSRGGSLMESRVYLAGTDGGTPMEFPIGAGNSMAAFGPDGKRLAYVHFSKWEQPPGRPGNAILEGEIWIAPADGANPVMASRLPGWPEGPVWSPDGSMVAFLQRAGPGESRPDVRVLTLTPEGRPVGTPARIKLPFETYRLLAGWTADNKIGLLRYNPEQESIYRVPATGGRAAQISAKGYYTSHPRWSRDGKRIYVRSGRGQIGWMPAEGGEVTLIPVDVDTAVMEREATPGGGNSVSPDGTTIVFSGATRGADFLHTNIWTLGVEGGQPKQLTRFSDTDTRFPCWSPDGRLVAFVARDTDGKTTGSSGKPGSLPAAGPLVFQVYVVSPDGTGLRKVTSEAHRVDWSSVAWSPDGRWIAFFSRDKTLSLIPAEGGDSRVVADLRRIDSLLVPGAGSLAHSEIAWSPDGKELAFSFDGRLWTVGVGGGAVTEIRTGLTLVRAIHLDWSPDGRTIAFTGSEGGDEQLWLMEDFTHLVKAAR